MIASMKMRRGILALTSALIAGCGGSGDGLSVATPLPTDGAASFAQIQSTILTPTCATSSCHAGSSPQGGLTLTSDVAYEQLLGVTPTNPNAKADGLKRIRAGMPDSSLLYHKLVFPPGHHAHDYGNPMPTGTAGLSIGQLEFVRQWIAAGAPKTGIVADASLLLNRSVQVTQPFAPLAAPAPGTGYQLKVDQFGVNANFERELFNYRAVGNASDAYVSRIETSMRPFSHHFVLYTFDRSIPSLLLPQPDVVRDIRNADGSMNMLNMLVMGYHVFFAGSMTQQSNYEFPAGTALRLPAGSSLDLNVHYANHTSATVQGEAYVNLYTVPASQVVHALSTLNLQNTSLTLPAGQVTTATKDFTFQGTTTVTALTSHMHARGTRFRIYVLRNGVADAQPVYENTDWEHPQIVTYASPIVLRAGDGLRSVVTYNNTTSRNIFFGLTSDDEMDIIFGYYY